MERDLYSMYIFTYKSKNDFGVKIIARNEETADRIMSIWNNEIKDKRKKWKHKVFGFKKSVKVDVAPYEAEQQQENWFEHIKDEYIKHAGKKMFGEIVYEENRALLAKKGA